MFFNYGTSNFNVSARITTQYNHKTKVPEAITNIICLSFSELENSVFLDFVLLRFTPSTSYSFSCPSCQASQLHCHVHVSEFVFPVEFNRAKKPTLALSSFSFSEINKALDTKEHNWWRVLIFLSQQLKILAIFYWQWSNTFTSTVFKRENPIKRLLWGLKQVLGSNLIPLRTNFDTQTTVISHRRRKRFSSSAG